MAEETIDPNIPDDFDNSVKEAGFAEPKAPKPTREKVYQVVGDSKIPVAKTTGKLWLRSNR